MALSREQSIQLVHEARSALVASQSDIGKIAGVVRQTVAKWEVGKSRLIAQEWARLARAVHPRDRALAARLAAAAGATLVSLGLEAPAASAASPAPPAAPPPPAPAHLVDSVVCAAAEAVDLSPKLLRAALVAAFTRANALRLGTDDVLAGLAPPAPAKTKGKG